VRKIFIRCEVAVPFEQVCAGFNKQLLEALSPALMKLRILRYDGQRKGDKFSMQLGPKIFNIRWEGMVSAAGQTPGTYWFEDVGLKLPFPLKHWKHKHLVRTSGQGAVIMDIVSFSTGNSFIDMCCYPLLKNMFQARISKYQRYSFV
jgi:ligand-binding SRPBCC domain-containing protein